MKKIIVRSVFSAMFSVSVCMLFLGGIIPGLSLRGGIPCAFAASFAGSLLAATASRTGRGETGGKKEEKAGTPDGRPDRESSAAAPGAAGKRGYEVYLRVVRYMEEKKPYLEESIGLEELSRAGKLILEKAVIRIPEEELFVSDWIVSRLFPEYRA